MMIFVVGSSRSGTTMVGRILGQNEQVFTFNEIHFFEQLWNPQAPRVPLAPEAAIQLASRLLTIQRDGYFRQRDTYVYADEARSLLADAPADLSAPEVFQQFIEYETCLHGKTIGCDQTPRNVFYLRELFDLYPDAYVVNMIRDSRDVLLSQKNKWKRRLLGASNIPRRELLRTYANYHPITMGLLWKAAVAAADRIGKHPHMYTMYFERLVEAPEQELRKLCAFLEIEFHSSMLAVPQIGSSHREDRSDVLGIDPERANRWQTADAERTDLLLCQMVTRAQMQRHGYTPANFPINWAALAFTLLNWPLKIGLALLLNAGRVQNLSTAIRKRLLPARS